MWLEIVLPDKRIRRVGIYKINYADHFYIGRSIYILRRVKAHRGQINHLLNDGEEIPENHYLIKVVNFCRKHPRLKEITFEVLENCKFDEDLMALEQKWLTHYENDPKCLNYGFVARLSAADTHKLNFVPYTETLEIKSQPEQTLYNRFLSDLHSLRERGYVWKL